MAVLSGMIFIVDNNSFAAHEGAKHTTSLCQSATIVCYYFMSTFLRHEEYIGHQWRIQTRRLGGAVK